MNATNRSAQTAFDTPHAEGADAYIEYSCAFPDSTGWLCTMRLRPQSCQFVWIPPDPNWRHMDEETLGECLPPEGFFTPAVLKQYRHFMAHSLRDYSERTGAYRALVEDVPHLGLRMFVHTDGQHRIEMHPARLGAIYDWACSEYWDKDSLDTPNGLPARQALMVLRERAFAVMMVAAQGIERDMASVKGARRPKGKAPR